MAANIHFMEQEFHMFHEALAPRREPRR